MKKKLIVLSLMLVILLVSSGCVEVTYGTYIKANGNVVKQYNVVVDENADFGPYTPEYALDIAREQLEYMLENQSEYGKIVVNEDNEYDISLVYTYKNLNEFYRAMGITGDDPPEENNAVIERELIYMYSTSEIFTDINQDYAFAFCEGMRNANFPLIASVPYSDISFNLEYGTKYTKVYTSNATREFIDNKTMIYRWEMKANEIDNARILTSKQPNYGMWYLAAIFTSIIISFIMYLVITISRGRTDGREQISL